MTNVAVLQLTQWARARLWFGTGILPFSSSVALETAVEARRQGRVPNAVVTVEAVIPRGGRTEYGLLGIRFDEDDCADVRVEVPYSTGLGSPWSDSLAAADDVRRGLPLDYAQGVMAAIAVRVTRRFPSGTIRVVEAAHGLVGSSTRFFEALAACLLDIMGDERDDVRMAELLKSRLVDREP